MEVPLQSAAQAVGWPTTEKRGWLPGEIDMAALTHLISAGERDAMLDLVRRWQSTGRPITEMGAADFSHSALDGMLASMFDRLKTGPGLVFFSGLPVEGQSRDEVRALYWGMGTHFGRAVSQNQQGELIGEVRVRSDAVTRRGYGNAKALILHTDRIDMLSLFCVSKPRSGGANLFISGLKVWDIVARERPDLLPLLERGFHQNRLGENVVPGEERTAYRVPVFGRSGALRSVLFSGNANLEHQTTFFADLLRPVDEEALTFLASVRDRPELALRNTLGIGDAVFINNHEILHNREAFEDGDTPEKKRLLLRLWLQGSPVRPKPETMTVMRNPSGLQGIDPRPLAA